MQARGGERGECGGGDECGPEGASEVSAVGAGERGPERASEVSAGGGGDGECGPE